MGRKNKDRKAEKMTFHIVFSSSCRCCPHLTPVESTMACRLSRHRKFLIEGIQLVLFVSPEIEKYPQK